MARRVWKQMRKKGCMGIMCAASPSLWRLRLCTYTHIPDILVRILKWLNRIFIFTQNVFLMEMTPSTVKFPGSCITTYTYRVPEESELVRSLIASILTIRQANPFFSKITSQIILNLYSKTYTALLLFPWLSFSDHRTKGNEGVYAQCAASSRWNRSVLLALHTHYKSPQQPGTQTGDVPVPSVLVGIYLCLTGLLLIHTPLNYLVPDLYAQMSKSPLYAITCSRTMFLVCKLLETAAAAILFSKELAPLRIPMNRKGISREWRFRCSLLGNNNNLSKQSVRHDEEYTG